MEILENAKNTLESLQYKMISKDVLKTANVGELDAIDLLVAQHREVDALFAAYEEAGDKAFRTKEKIYETIAAKLRLHAALEENHFYPAASRVIADQVREGEEEHAVFKDLLDKIDELAAEDETFDAKVTVLRELVHHHVGEEERDLFPVCRSKMGREKLDELGSIMHAQTLREDEELKQAKAEASKGQEKKTH